MDDRRKLNFNSTQIQSLEHKKAVIEDIQKSIGEYKTKEQSILVQNLIKIISRDIYSEERRFIAEIIQNSDDASVMNKELRIHIYFFDNHILIGHYGKEFDENDVRSICFAGDSTKKQNKDTTGYKGIGFKSVFTHAKKIFVISGGFQFRFEENKDKTKQLYPWQIFPIWSTEDDIGEVEIFEKAKDFKVGIIIELRNQKTFEECKNFFLEFKHDQNYLLFLKCPNIEFKIFEKNKETLRIKKTAYKDNNDKFIINCIDKTSQNSGNSSSEGDPSAKSNNNENNKKNKGGSSQEQLLNCYYMKKYYCDMENDEYITKSDMDAINDDEQIPSKLKDLKNIEISFAVKLSKDANSIVPLEKNERIIYSYLPTKVNYNFPFLLNSNVILDAGRGLLTDHIFNKCLISVLPKYISKFQEDVRSSFFNQYALVLVKDFNIDNKNFEKIFSQNLEYEKSFYSQKLTLFTLKNNKKNFRECFCENIALDNSARPKPLKNMHMNNLLSAKKPLFNSMNEDKILDFLRSLIEDQSVAERLEKYLKDFFEKNRKFIYKNENRIDSKDVEYVTIIAKYYNVDIVFLDFDDLIEFLKSDHYREIYSALFILKLLDKLKKTSFLEKFKRADLKILKNNRGEFISPVNAFYYENAIKEDEMEVANLTTNANNNINTNSNLNIPSNEVNLESEDTSKKTKRKAGKGSKKETEKVENTHNDFDKYLLSYEIYELFANENKLGLLNDIGVQSHSSNEQVENIMKNIHIYDENNSYKITKILFEQWRKTQTSERKKYVEILKNKRLHTQGKGFIHPHCVILGRSFCVEKNFDQFSDWFLNDKYWNYFFEEDLKKLENIEKTREGNKHIEIKIEGQGSSVKNQDHMMIVDDKLDQSQIEADEELNSDNEIQTNNLNKIIKGKRAAFKKPNSKKKSKTNNSLKKRENPNSMDNLEKKLKKQLDKNFSDFKDFFKELEIWTKPEPYVYLFTKEIFFDSPFFDRKFIELNRKKFESDYGWYIFNSPDFPNLYERSFEEIAEFFKLNIKNIDEEELDRLRVTQYHRVSQKEIKNKEFSGNVERKFEDFEKNNTIQYKYCNYFKWFFDENGKKIPTTLNTLEKLENVLSYDVVKRIENEEIKKIYLKTLTFCYNEIIWEVLSKVGYKFKEKPDFDNYQCILRALYQNYILLTDEAKITNAGFASEPNSNLTNNAESCKFENDTRKSSRKMSSNKKILSKDVLVKEQKAKDKAENENISKEKLKISIKTEYKLILDILYSLNTNRKLDDDIYLLNMEDDFVKPSELVYDEKCYAKKNTSALFHRKQANQAILNSKAIYISSFIRENCRNIELIDKSEIDSNNYKSRFLNFFKANSINVVSESDNHISYSDLNEELLFLGYLNEIKDKLFKNFRIDNENKLTNIRLFSTDQLQTLDKYGDSVKDEVFHKEIDRKANTLKLIFRKDDTYGNWQHPTILYFIASSICRHYEAINLTSVVLTLFNLLLKGAADEEIDEFMDLIE